jgi:RNA polymerase subunit RPABC4/transcription elongation factor Spt4
MNKMCWSCTELYDETIGKCPYCGEPRDKPFVKIAEVIEEKTGEVPKRSHKKK